MIFYEDFVEQVKNTKYDDKKDKYTFFTNFKSYVFSIIFGIILLIIGVYSFIGAISQNNLGRIILSSILSIIGLYYILKTILYKIVIFKDKLVINRTSINFDNIDSINLKFMKVSKKRANKCLDILTKDKKEIVLQLSMNNPLKFVKILENRLADKFKIYE